jgi:tetratricopeptide (TPR) repeat protein
VHAEAARLFEQSERLAREAGDRQREVQAMGYRARALYNVAGEHAAAMRLVEQTLALSRESSDVVTTGWMLLWLGGDALTEGNRGHARAFCMDALTVFRGWQDGIGTGTTSVGAALLVLAIQDYLDGDFAAGRARCRESLLIYHNVGETSSAVIAFEGLGVAAAGEGRWERALRLAGYARAMKPAMLAAQGPSDSARTLFLEQLERAVDRARRQLGEPAATAAWRAGEAMTYEQAIAHALEEDVEAPAAPAAAPVPATIEAAAANDVPTPMPSPAPAPAGLYVDGVTHEVRIDAQPLRVRLSALEFQLLHYLYERRPRVCTRRELGDALWGAHAWDVNMLHGLVRRLKEKLEPDPAHPRYVITVPQVGYRLIAEPAD